LIKSWQLRLCGSAFIGSWYLAPCGSAFSVDSCGHCNSGFVKHRSRCVVLQTNLVLLRAWPCPSPPGLSSPCLKVHCVGFHDAVVDLVQGTRHCYELLPCVWRAFVQLWDEALKVRSAPIRGGAQGEGETAAGRKEI